MYQCMERWKNYDTNLIYSVVGLNFDFQGLNIMGFVLYSLFNIGLYSIPELRVSYLLNIQMQKKNLLILLVKYIVIVFKTEYSARHPRGLNPVQINDIVFAIHASIACLITIIQCFVYESAGQRVSIIATGILSIFAG